MKIILQKLIAQSGNYSRRKAEDLIKKGKVKVNGQIAIPGDRADEDDQIEILGRKIKTNQKKIYIKFHKPKEYTCTNRKFKGEKNIFDIVKIPEKLFAVGRLDKDSRGLMLLTNDGELAQKMSHPSFKCEKKYLVLVKEAARWNKKKIGAILKHFKDGMDIGERSRAKAKSIRYIGKGQFEIVLIEGKKRQLRRMFEGFRLSVDSLKRIQIGNLHLADLKEGKWAYLKKEEIESLKNN